jgi:hypothetical protein
MELKKDKWTISDTEEFNSYLLTFSKGKEKSIWEQKLVNTNKKCTDVPSPKLKEIAKEIFKGNFISFIDLWIMDNHSSISIIGYLICKIKDFDLMKKLSLFVKEDALKDVKFDNITSSLQLNNSTINFEPIAVRSNVVDFEFFGKHGLDNNIDYQFAINLLENAEKNSAKVKLFVKVEGLINDPKFKFNLQSDMKKVKEKVNNDKREIISAIDKDFKLNLEEAKKDKKDWEKQEKGEYIIEWEEEKEEVKKEKEFENSEFIIEWED